MRDTDLDADPALASVHNPINTTFKTEDARLYVIVVNLSTEDDSKPL